MRFLHNIEINAHSAQAGLSDFRFGIDGVCRKTTEGQGSGALQVHLLAALFALVVLTGCANFRSKNEVVEVDAADLLHNSAYKHGLQAYKHGHLNKAAQKFERAIAEDPNHGAAYNNLGLVYFEERKLALAAINFDMAIGLLPDHATPLNNLGMALEAGGRMPEAVEYYERARALEPDNPLYLGNLVSARIRLGETGEPLRSDLQHLAFIESRPDWLDWVDEQLALRNNPFLDRGPTRDNPLSRDRDSTQDLPDPNAEAIELSPSFRLDDSSNQSPNSGSSEALPVPVPRVPVPQ